MQLKACSLTLQWLPASWWYHPKTWCELNQCETDTFSKIWLCLYMCLCGISSVLPLGRLQSWNSYSDGHLVKFEKLFFQNYDKQICCWMDEQTFSYCFFSRKTASSADIISFMANRMPSEYMKCVCFRPLTWVFRASFSFYTFIAWAIDP